MEKTSNDARGRMAEMIAALYLWAKGYRIRAWRYKTNGGEIDLIVTRGRTLVFVEVKARPTLDQAVGAILPASYTRLQRAAAQYVVRHPAYNNYILRFDLVAVAPICRIRHLDNIQLHGA